VDGRNLSYPKHVSRTAFSTKITAPIDYRGCSICTRLMGRAPLSNADIPDC